MPRDFEIEGYLDHPNCRHYPTQDKNNLTDEKEYIQGWLKASYDKHREREENE